MLSPSVDTRVVINVINTNDHAPQFIFPYPGLTGGRYFSAIDVNSNVGTPVIKVSVSTSCEESLLTLLEFGRAYVLFTEPSPQLLVPKGGPCNSMVSSSIESQKPFSVCF